MPESLFWSLSFEGCNFIKRETLAQVLSCEFCEISENTFFTEHLLATASLLITYITNTQSYFIVFFFKRLHSCNKILELCFCILCLNIIYTFIYIKTKNFRMKEKCRCIFVKIQVKNTGNLLGKILILIVSYLAVRVIENVVTVNLCCKS